MSRKSFVQSTATMALGLSTVVFSHVSHASPGDLDWTFSPDGRVVIDHGPDGPGRWASALAVQTDDKLVVVSHPEGDVRVSRYDTDGALDDSFGANGVVSTYVPPNWASDGAIAVQNDGKIVVAASVFVDSVTPDFLVVRYNADGSLDTTFDGDGIVVSDFDGDDQVTGVSALEGGAVLVLGLRRLARYTAEGSLDAAFGVDGSVSLTGWLTDAVTIDSEDRILVVGSWFGCSVARLTPDGSFDPSFANGGVATAPEHAVCTAVTVRADGKIVAAGTSSGALFLVRFDADGELDAAFGVNGVVKTTIKHDKGIVPGLRPRDDLYTVANAVLADGDRMIAFGHAWRPKVPGKVVVLRYEDDGGLDPSFDADGMAFARYDNSITNFAADRQSDGKIVALNTEQLDDPAARMAFVRFSVAHTCPAEPIPAAECLSAPESELRIGIKGYESKNQLKWRWRGGDAFDASVLGTPTAETTYTLCVYDAALSAFRLVTSVDLAPGTSWRDRDRRGWLYVDKTRRWDGVGKLQLRAGEQGKTTVLLTAKGAEVELPRPIDANRFFAQDGSVIAQLINSTGVCWSTEFKPADTLINSTDGFRARSGG